MLTNEEIAKIIGDTPYWDTGNPKTSIYPSYSTDADAALRVLKWMGESYCLRYVENMWVVSCDTTRENFWYNPLFPLAVLAAFEWFVKEGK